MPYWRLSFSGEERRLFESLLLSLLLESDNLLVTHGRQHGDGDGLAGVEGGADLATEVVGHVGELDVLAAVALLVHEGSEVLVGDVDEGVVLAGHVGHVGSVRRGDDILWEKERRKR